MALARCGNAPTFPSFTTGPLPGTGSASYRQYSAIGVTLTGTGADDLFRADCFPHTRTAWEAP